MLGLILREFFCQFVTCETNQLYNELIIYCIGDFCKYIVV